MYFVFPIRTFPIRTFLWLIESSCLWLDHSDSEDYFLTLLYLQNGSAHSVGANYSGLYEEGEVKVPQLLCETEPS